MSISGSVRVWDIPTRVFHWLVVGLVFFSWGSAEYGHMDLHRLSGSILLGLVTFRIIWGFIGSNTARFANFLRWPWQVYAYLRTPAGRHAPGHNPLGAYSVIAMLLLLLLQIGSGLFSVDIDGLESGPLSRFVSFDLGRKFAGIHHISFTLLQIVVAVHILAILFYLVIRRRNLVFPMITGRDRQIESSEGQLTTAGLGRFAVAAAVGLAVSTWTALGMPL